MKKGQMELSFGMIFSIILIIVFLVFAFMGIQKFIGIGNQATNLKFTEDLKEDVNKIYLGSKASIIREYRLTKDVEAVCFTDQDEGNNLAIHKKETFPQRENILYVDMEKTLQGDVTDKGLCFVSSNQKIILKLTKDFGETLITIERPEN